MSLELSALRDAVATYGRVVRVLVLGVRGSAPREAGTAMLVWPGGQSGTIGGGALEWQAAERARACTAPEVLRLPLGPALGQCCGGAVTLVLEPFDAARLGALRLGDGVAMRPIAPDPGAMPSAAFGPRPGPRLIDGWLVEPLHRPARSLWVWGAGHVGRAVVAVAAPLPDLAITWVDFARHRFPAAPPDQVTLLWDKDPARQVAGAPRGAEHLVLTHDHALDLALCHGLLRHGFATLGLIGSATKRARFRTRLAALGHPPDAIARLRCPIGDPALGRHPQAIALGVVAELLRTAPATRDSPADTGAQTPAAP
ncbi:MAG: xanthine dehydrogenase accessory protein XdhC [Alkalilacustris sp.]